MQLDKSLYVCICMYVQSVYVHKQFIDFVSFISFFHDYYIMIENTIRRNGDVITLKTYGISHDLLTFLQLFYIPIKTMTNCND